MRNAKRGNWGRIGTIDGPADAAPEWARAVYIACRRLEGSTADDEQIGRWACTAWNVSPVIVQGLFEDLRGGLYGEAGEAKARALVRKFPELEQVPIDEEQDAWRRGPGREWWRGAIECMHCGNPKHPGQLCPVAVTA